ncbi:L7Ae/L30e/S12e/Gadd45 family ribosomal protein [Haloplasma contractile]|uniref:Ribosomal protein L7A family protein n=1 Tax=Haloplasma contractile SSD-17B TaxID=1033810 RepID=U2EF22_9MOLU|nr:ribosomal L7Ae/L30e/S12e/Gadd45 family protein [Haloplasma contractile]ERJ13523.1 Ribosomal protein L7A family protein [Haloplasma contractile SSD-17B]
MKKFMQFLGLASRAGCTVTGEDQILNEIKSKKSNQSNKLLIIAADAADGTKKKYRDKCTFYKVDYIEYGNSSDLSHAIGKMGRVAVCITDAGFKRGLLDKL